MIYTATFWLDSLERAVYTFAQTALGMIAGNGLGLFQMDLAALAVSSAGAAVVSVLTSILNAKRRAK